MPEKKKVRVDLKKNRSKPPRERSWTKGFQDHGYQEEATTHDERVRAKGDLSRKRTIMQTDESLANQSLDMPANSRQACLRGRVLRVHGPQCVVEADDGKVVRCAIRRLLRNLTTDERSILTTGDVVWFRSAANDEGMIERIEPRHGVLTRASRNREHVLVANVDQFAIIMSLVEPELKPHLVDRYLAGAEKGGLAPILCFNKADKVDLPQFQSLVGYYCQLGVHTLLTSATTGLGMDRLRELLRGRATVFSGQSGVGKSSLLNALQPGLQLRVAEVSETSSKGKHTTTTAELLRLESGGWVVDTPGIRQFELWDNPAENVEGLFPEIRPYVSLCGHSACTHVHEERCAVKKAVELRRIRSNRYISYLGLLPTS